jgi:hypothetical protein
LIILIVSSDKGQYQIDSAVELLRMAAEAA